ncbi:MAG: hypothetical protein LCH63_10640 [Candidatus Melainabacteria bacterium]|nr:hypothetical protein [Candidatus Melainabacteria bacterium]
MSLEKATVRFFCSFLVVWIAAASSVSAQVLSSDPSRTETETDSLQDFPSPSPLQIQSPASLDQNEPLLRSQTVSEPVLDSVFLAQNASPSLRGLGSESNNSFLLNASMSDLEEVTVLAAKKELELIGLNAKYRVESTKVDRYKTWRSFAFNMGQYVFSNIGIDHVAYARWRTWQRPSTAGKSFLTFGPSFLIVGHSIGTAGALTELTIDAWRARQLRKMKMDEKSYRQKVNELKSEIDRLLLRRQTLIESKQFSEEAAKFASREGALLKNMRDAALIEYRNFCVRGKAFRTGRDVANLMSLGGATTGGYLGALCGLLAITNRKPNIAGPAGIGFIVSGGFIVLGPVVSKVSSIAASRRLTRSLDKELGQLDLESVKNLESGSIELSRLADNVDLSSAEGMKIRLKLYQAGAAAFHKDSAMALAEKLNASREFKERVLANTLIGGTKIGWGVQLARAGFGFHQAPAPRMQVISVNVDGKNLPIYSYRPKTPGSVFSHRVAMGATTFIPGTAIGILDTMQNRARGQIKTNKLKKEGKLPAMVIAQRLSALENLDRQLEEELQRLQSNR